VKPLVLFSMKFLNLNFRSLFTGNDFFFEFQLDITDKLLKIIFLFVGSMLGLVLELLLLVLFSEVCVPGCVVDDDDVSVDLHVILLSGS
jgi:hypothetical protein